MFGVGKRYLISIRGMEMQEAVVRELSPSGENIKVLSEGDELWWPVKDLAIVEELPSA